MRAYIVRRILLMIPVMFLVSVVLFCLIRFIPGGIVEQMVANQPFTMDPLSEEQIAHSLGLDIPIHIQYWNWIVGIITHGDFGESLWTRTPVLPDILARFPISIELGIIAIISGLLVAIPIGIYSAIRQDTIGDFILRSMAIAYITLPSFWIATLIIVFAAIWWGWSPPVTYTSFLENPGENIKMFLIPGIILGMQFSGITMRMMRTMMLEVLRQDYIRTAWAKGLNERTVIIRHALKNALIPVVTMVGLRVPTIVSGSIVLENIFGLPGIGALMIDVIAIRDYPVINGINFIISAFILAMNLLVDISYAFLDPRIQYS